MNNTENWIREYGLGRFGSERYEFLKKHKPEVLERMEREGTLKQHLIDTDKEAGERKFSIIDLKKKAEGVDIKMQSENFGLYLQKIETIDKEAEHQVFEEMIYM